ncbi:hypothetical protein [Streptomyces sp. CBMA29]|uniref:hypothetical protein n=1 Tax=Streptomyces sp. CBMA29 TaxID=1896314 RepID=UPI001661EF34|nr:hypothetical protein [Streptomyces sp. CBMA29]MBD0735726.1 hypothetical protein [Streptomyces sp. CBMA29]
MSISDLQDHALALTEARPISLHLDERDRSATVTVRRPGLPDDAPDGWRERGFNAHETSTTYRDIDDVTITGWTHTPMTRWTTAPGPHPGRVTVTLSGSDQHVTFSADHDVRTARRGFLSGAI